MRLRRSLATTLCCAAAITLASVPPDASSLPISQLESLASTALSTSQFTDALALYDLILERDSSDGMASTFYKRATVRLAMGQWTRARDGFREVLAKREDVKAREELVRVCIKLGEWEEAAREVQLLLKSGTGLETAKLLDKNLQAAQSSFASSSKLLSTDPTQCITSLEPAILHSPQSLSVRLLRAECALASNDFSSAIGDLSRSASLSSALNANIFIRLALLNAFFVEVTDIAIPSEAMIPVKKCLNADPEHKECKKAFKSLKALEKEFSKLRNWIEGGRWAEASIVIAGSSSAPGVLSDVRELLGRYNGDVLPLESAEKHSPLVTKLLSTLCQAYSTIGSSRKADRVCEEVLTRDENDTWGLVAKGERALTNEAWDEAVGSLAKAFEQTGRTDRTILEKLQKAQRLQKQAGQKDYYKVVGVARDADERTIKKAYRKATLKAHPDKEGGSEAKMAALNEAYEVLTNPELRARFDNGEDPNDPHASQGQPFFQGGGNPFGAFAGGGSQQFFQQFGGFGGGGGGGSFKVRFG